MALNITSDLTIGGGKKITDVELIAGAIRTIPSSSVTASMTAERVEDGQVVYAEHENKLYKANKEVDEFFTTTITWQPFEWPSSGNISGSASSSGSFGNINATTVNATTITATEFIGGVFQGALSSSAQIAQDISGSFNSTSHSLQLRLGATELELENTLVSQSAQIATEVSGAFAASSASIDSRIDNIDTRLVVAENELGNSLLSSSAQIAIDISGSFQGELSGSNQTFVGGGVSGSVISTGSFGRTVSTTMSTDKVNSNLIPTDNDIFDLGSTSLKWNEVYAKTGSLNTLDLVDNLTLDDVNIEASGGQLMMTGSNFIFKATNDSNLLSLVDTNGELSVQFDNKVVVLAPKSTVGDNSDAVAGGLIYSSSNEFYLGFAD